LEKWEVIKIVNRAPVAIDGKYKKSESRQIVEALNKRLDELSDSESDNKYGMTG